MQSIVLAFIHRCSFVYMVVILTAVFSQGLDVPVIVINSDHGPTNVESMERDGVEVHTLTNARGVAHKIQSLSFTESQNVLL